mmetsp:Transcript_22790/g.32595  ORF Transcript_22790/g.32595 Transcript_22790/m.32595 type:complete len:299 (+) Transcript_22790:81-977(+)|eukprot:CAMPEP_0201709758 /NCGR_PEP_ID=MMETSP0578-20130828/58270_1 /ASSEMBLY_ACC=CAM_ASM_000663 /TAXON_ID=267565 /ORGANISM="Skeletonema grethea, Strain CCMP 1804" /LENGTH=298 /DNA_ID=CAMNT_0048198749 /DNA_START=53 /DNA_END=949 /DNA_ORIENTATION=+
MSSSKRPGTVEYSKWDKFEDSSDDDDSESEDLDADSESSEDEQDVDTGRIIDDDDEEEEEDDEEESSSDDEDPFDSEEEDYDDFSEEDSQESSSDDDDDDGLTTSIESIDQQLLNSLLGEMKYPREFGRVVEDLSSDAPPNTPKSLYVIFTDTNQRDFNALPKPYGVFWSAEGPGPVNNIAIELWPKFGSVEGRDSEHNIEGEETKPGECYDGFACLNYGQTALSMNVRKVEVDHERYFMLLYRKGLLEEALVLRGIDMDDRIMGAIKIMETVMGWKREKGALDPLYDVFGYPEEKEK